MLIDKFQIGLKNIIFFLFTITMFAFKIQNIIKKKTSVIFHGIELGRKQKPQSAHP